MFIKQKKFYLTLIVIISALILLYAGYALYISFTLNDVIQKAIKQEPYNKSVENVISEEDYKTLIPFDEDGESMLEEEVTEYGNTFPIIFPFITDAYFRYTYLQPGEYNVSDAFSSAAVKLNYSKFPFCISDVEISP